MFALTRDDLAGRILGCGDGPASFNAVSASQGMRVVSADPIYAFSAREIRERIAATAGEIADQTRRNQHEFVWTEIRSVEELVRLRMTAMNEFLADYEDGRMQGRYIDASLPALPFADSSFDLAVCSHLLFLYSEQLGGAFHDASVLELCRVAKEVRIFPLVALGGTMSPFVSSTGSIASNAGYVAAIEQVPYEFQRGGNQMMRITREVRPA